MTEKCKVDELIEIISIFAKGGGSVSPDTLLLEEELIDSINVMQIIAEIEARYGLRFGAMDISFDDFSTANTLLSAVLRLQSS